MHFDLITVLDNGKIPKKRIIQSTEVRKDFRVKMADPDTKQDSKGNTKIKQNSTNYHKKLIPCVIKGSNSSAPCIAPVVCNVDMSIVFTQWVMVDATIRKYVNGDFYDTIY